MRAITPTEYSELLIWIKDNCWFYNYPPRKWKIVKYVECSFDARTWDIWLIILPEYNYSIRDDLKNEEKSIADEIKEYLLKK